MQVISQICTEQQRIIQQSQMRKYFEKQEKSQNYSQPQKTSQHYHHHVNQYPQPALSSQSSARPFFKSKTLPKPNNMSNNLQYQKEKSYDEPLMSIDKIYSQNLKRTNEPQIKESHETSARYCESSDDDKIKNNGFSLQYLKMTKKFRVKSLLQISLEKAYRNKGRPRVKTQMDQNYNEPSSNRQSLNRSTQTQGNFPNTNQIQQSKTPTSKLFTTTVNLSSKKQKLQTLLAKYNNPLQPLPFKTNILPPTPPPQSPIDFIPIDSIRLSTTKNFFTTNYKANMNDQKTSSREQNASFLRKSKYSPFKSRNHSSNEQHEGENTQIVNVKEFDQDKDIMLRTSVNNIKGKKFNVNNHKRLKSQRVLQAKDINQNQIKRANTQPESLQQLSLSLNQQTFHILVSGLFGNLKLLFDIKQCFQLPKSGQQNLSPQKVPSIDLSTDRIKELLKIYVFGQKIKENSEDSKSKKEKLYENQYFSQFEMIVQTDEDRKMMRQIVCLERLLIICMVQLLGQGKLLNLFEELSLTLISLISIYIQIFREAMNSPLSQHLPLKLKQEIAQISQILKIRKHISIAKHLKNQLLPYTQSLYRHSKQLYESKLKPLIEESAKLSINRTFYECLRKYAIYLTKNEEKIIGIYRDLELIACFATCPAPYILQKTHKRYSLCVDLDETLLHSSFSCTKQFATSYRPFAKEFIIQLSKYFQIIIFTSSLKQYADEVIKPFSQFVDHVLYRQHVTRGKNLAKTLKDLTRVGRDLKKVIFIDDLESNARLQKDNAVIVSQWKGQRTDDQLRRLKQILLKLGKDEKQVQDVKEFVKKIKDQLKKG